MLELSLSPVKQFDFAWNSVGAQWYELLESVEGGDPYVQVGEDLFNLTTSLTVPLHFRSDASYVLRACTGNECSDSQPVDVVGSLVDAIGYFKASNSSFEDYFGGSVALSADGNTLVVGAPQESSNATGIGGDQLDSSSIHSGAVFVYVRDSMTAEWSAQPIYIKAPNTNPGDSFGGRLALSADGNTLAVAAIGEDSNATGIDGNLADNSITGAGAVYVYVRDPMTLEWSPQPTYVKASNPGASDAFGFSVALSADGNTLAVGAHFESSNATGLDGNLADNSATRAGAVYVYVRDAMTLEWSPQPTYVKASNTNAQDQFGNSVALSADGNVLAVGAHLEDGGTTGIDGNQANNAAVDAGAAYIYLRDPMTLEWSPLPTYIKASNTEVQDTFGHRVVLSGDGNTLAVSAHYEDSNATGIDGNQADNSASRAGAVYVYVRDPMTLEWSAQPTYVKASNTEGLDFFGVSVALSSDGSTLAIGADYERSAAVGIGGDQADNSANRSGAVYVYTRDPMSLEWSMQPKYVKASNPDPFDQFGGEIAVNADGTTLAISAPGESSVATGIDGDQADNSAELAGAVYVY